ncbi:hypothetical protein, conserved [Babesia bigemina]|uniref:ALA-interacting subunit n=1 Tax=Babesia bigemina TaxID=5866 RepID=A0A061D1E2_BABBI|nr:hypothetical protein, conserved [Babesia bigemina]CDR94621.1 hypothetical protein, conserved [Babesia bigemina]|eukprot:XP_012766807.1 hypothetical protein, conserved [Babesia bigemina]
MAAGEERETRFASRSRISTRLSNSANSVRVGDSSFNSQDYSTSQSFDAEETVREILFRRRNTSEQEAGLSRFRRDRSQKAMHNSRRLGLIMLVLGLINGGLFALLQARRKAYAECTVVVPDRLQRGYEKWVHPITEQNCSGDTSRFEKANKIYIYYSINNYPFHGAAAFKLHSKNQLEGMEPTKNDIHSCYPYHVVSIAGVEKIIYPCGPHLWHFYSDIFKFSTENPDDSTVFLPIDDSLATLSYCQDYTHMRNPPDKSINETFKTTYYWLQENSIAVNSDENSESGENVDTGFVTRKSAQNISAIRTLMNARAGRGLQNGHIIQWMTPSPFKTFKKLYGVLQGPIAFPLYVTMHVTYDAESFGGWKSLSLVASGWPYGKLVPVQSLLGLIAAMCCAFALLLLLTKPGDPQRCVNLL